MGLLQDVADAAIVACVFVGEDAAMVFEPSASRASSRRRRSPGRCRFFDPYRLYEPQKTLFNPRKTRRNNTCRLRPRQRSRLSRRLSCRLIFRCLLACESYRRRTRILPTLATPPVPNRLGVGGRGLCSSCIFSDQNSVFNTHYPLKTCLRWYCKNS